MAGSDGRYMFNFSKKLLNCFPKSLSVLYDHRQCLRLPGPSWPGKLAPWLGNALRQWTGPTVRLNLFISCPSGITILSCPMSKHLKANVSYILSSFPVLLEEKRSRPFYSILATNVKSCTPSFDWCEQFNWPSRPRQLWPLNETAVIFHAF